MSDKKIKVFEVNDNDVLFFIAHYSAKYAESYYREQVVSIDDDEILEIREMDEQELKNKYILDPDIVHPKYDDPLYKDPKGYQHGHKILGSFYQAAKNIKKPYLLVQTEH